MTATRVGRYESVAASALECEKTGIRNNTTYSQLEQFLFVVAADGPIARLALNRDVARM